MPATFLRPVTTPAAARDLARAGPEGDRAPLVSLTTDFGLRDPSAAICRGVILGIAPRVRIVDISHEVAKFAIADGALLLGSALPYLPVGVHVAVVDPGVGTERLPLAIQVARGDVLVGPDNGMLLPAARRLGGVNRVHVLENPDYRLPVVSFSFHGRDVFAPAAAHLAIGVPIGAFGRSIDPAALIQLDLPEPLVTPGALETAVVYVDTFGNVKFAGEPADLEAALGPLAPRDVLTIRRPAAAGLPAIEESVPWATTFAGVPVGAALLYEDSYGRLCLAVNQGSAAARIGLRAPLEVTISRAR